jgi:hypothetical protein
MSEPTPPPLAELLFGDRLRQPAHLEPDLADVISAWYRRHTAGPNRASTRKSATPPRPGPNPRQ